MFHSLQHIRAALLVLVASFLAARPMCAHAATISMDVIPSLRLEQGWDSNIFNATTKEVSDYYFRAKPGVTLQWNTPGAGIRLGGYFEGTWYYQNPEANQEPTWNFTLGLTGGEAVQVTPTFSVVPSVYYINTINSSRRTQLLPSGDPLVPPVTTATYGNTRSQDFGGGIALRYLATERITFGLTGNYGERRFSGNTSDLVNSTTAGGAASVSYLFTPRTSVGVGLAGSHNTYENSELNPGSNIFSAGFLFGHQFSRNFSLNVVFGMSYANQDATSRTPEEKTSSPSGSFNLSYGYEAYTASVFGSGVYSGGSGFGELTRQGTVGLAIAEQFAREWSWNLSGSYQISRSVFETNTVDLNTVYGTAGLRFQPWYWLIVDLTGNINHQVSGGQVGSPVDDYSVLLGVTIEKTYNVF